MQNMNLWQQLIYYYQHNGSYVLAQFSRHFLISIYGVLIAAVVGIPIGIFIAHHGKLSGVVIGIANVIQTIPSLAMLSIIMIGLGLGVNTVIVTVFLYALLPIIKNTDTGMRNVDASVLDSGKGMGMTRWQLLRLVELPLSLSVIMAGLRNAWCSPSESQLSGLSLALVALGISLSVEQMPQTAVPLSWQVRYQLPDGNRG